MTSTLLLRGKVILITGAGSGIGRASSLKLAKLGASLALIDVDTKATSDTKDLCNQVSNTGQSHSISLCDISSSIQVARVVEQILHHHQRINHVFNCAGVNPTPITLESTSDGYFSKLVDVNLRGTFNSSRACLPYLIPGASIVNVSSMAAIRPGAGQAVYAATKAGIIAMSKAVALEVGQRDIRVNVIAPGDIETTTNSAINEGDEAMQRSKERVALGRFGLPEEIAEVAAFLFSDASRYTNGAVIEVHGGLA
jgi:NAD(P)-dependent dehydrogenase (short-subunit alcohol dehydrogenase family)